MGSRPGRGEEKACCQSGIPKAPFTARSTSSVNLLPHQVAGNQVSHPLASWGPN
jgi:hypothetical protein